MDTNEKTLWTPEVGIFCLNLGPFIFQPKKMKTLPNWVLGLVCGYLRMFEVLAVRCVCREWRGAKAMWQTLALQRIDDKQLRVAIQACVSRWLRELNLAFCFDINAGFVHLTSLPNLRRLDFTWCSGMTDDGLVHVAKLSNLQYLDLTNCHRVTDTGLSHIKTLCLKGLRLRGCSR